VRSRATRGTINRSMLLLLECKIIPGSHANIQLATAPSAFSSSSSSARCVTRECLAAGDGDDSGWWHRQRYIVRTTVIHIHIRCPLCCADDVDADNGPRARPFRLSDFRFKYLP
jgi:hypothetical protein